MPTKQQQSSTAAFAGRRLARRRAALVAVLAVAAVAGGALYYRWASPRLPILEVELAGDAATGRRLVAGRHADVAAAVTADWVLIAGYVLGLTGACWLGLRVAWTATARAAAALALAASVAAGIADTAENVLLYAALGRPTDLLWRSVQVAAYLKFGLLLYAVPAAAVAWLYAVGRLLSRPPAADPADPADVQVLAPPPLEPPAGARLPDRPAGERAAAAEHWARARRLPPGRRPAEVGICVSGGGIRSACVALGALQELRAAGELRKAGYLVSVSGGGYLAGALQLALQPRRQPGSGAAVADPNAATADDVLAPGSVEEDHLRRHSRYIADTSREWAAALGVLLRGMLMSLTLITLTVAVAGFALAAFYRRVPVSRALAALQPQFAQRGDLPFPATEPGVLIAAALAAGAALLAYLVAAAGPALAATVDDAARPAGAARLVCWCTRAGSALTGLAGLLVLLGVGIPALVWADAKILGALAHRGGLVSTPAGGAASTVLLAYLAALAGMAWRSRAQVGRGLGWLRRRTAATGGTARGLPRSLTQQLLVWLTFAVLLAALLLLLGAVVGSAGRWPSWLPIVVWTAFGAAVLCLDQTWLSLHPFYRRRLASAFSVRRATDADGQVVAAPYAFDAERTSLSSYGAPVAGVPQVIFAAAANLTGCDRTPPGRRAASFTFSHDWVGGPDVGWVRTARLEQAARGQLRRDLTVQAAVAISGAAFASAMGRQSRAYQTLFALSNARLGAWLPNPAFLHMRQQAGGDWRVPRLPRLRRLNYLLREITGAFPPDDRLLYCTDGGHYENLGLVELLRIGCRLIYCVDASGDSPPFATTLAEAITLAREELGVRIALDAPRALVPGAATALDPADPLAALNARLSRSGVVVGRISYPTEVSYPDGPSATGLLVVAKASLPAELPYELLSYAVSHPVFPRDSTSDQWFDHGQFDAYQAVGAYLGRCAVDSARAARAATAPAAPSTTPAGMPAATPAGMPAAAPADGPVRPPAPAGGGAGSRTATAGEDCPVSSAPRR